MKHLVFILCILLIGCSIDRPLNVSYIEPAPEPPHEEIPEEFQRCMLRANEIMTSGIWTLMSNNIMREELKWEGFSDEAIEYVMSLWDFDPQ